jgi:hypothetical protein
MPNRSSEIKQFFEDMLSNFLEWDGVYKLDSIDRALLKTEANSLYKISKDIDKNLRSRFIVTAKNEDLDIIGEGMNRPRLGGESDDDYRKRLVINDTFFNDSTVKGIKNALRGYYGVDIDNDNESDTRLVELYKEALRCGDEFNDDVKFLGEKVVQGSISIHLLMNQEGDEVIISRKELFDKIYQTRAAGILLYLYWHGTEYDNIRKKLFDKNTLTTLITSAELGDTDRKIAADNKSLALPILKRSDVFDVRTKSSKIDNKYDILVGTDNGAAHISHIDIQSAENNDGGKRFEDDLSKGTMSSRRVHRLLDGNLFSLPKDFQTPLRVGQRNKITLFNHTTEKAEDALFNYEENITKKIVKIESSKNIRLKIEDGTINDYKVILQVVPKEYNGDDLLYFGDMILTDYLLEGAWYNINEKELIENANIKLIYDPNKDEYITNGYYISPPITIDNITKFGMIKWVYNNGDTKVQIRTGLDEEYLKSLGDNDGWGLEYTKNTGEFIQESVNNFFQFKISLTGTIYESPIFRLEEFFIEYWDIPISEIEEVFDNIKNGNDLVNSIDNSSIIATVYVESPNYKGNGGSNLDLELNKSYWLTNIKPVRQSRIRNRRWSLFYGVKTIITDYFTRDSIHQYERDVEII